MNIPLANAYAIIDAERGVILRRRLQWAKGTDQYKELSGYLRMLNKLKKEFAHLSDADQIPLGL